MASAPRKPADSNACAAAAAPAPPPPTWDQSKCEDCGEREASLFCPSCRYVFCIECDAAIHVRVLHSHVRIPLSERPALCSVHNEEATVYCKQDQRLACLACVASIPPGDCFPHHTKVKPIAEAAEAARAELEAFSKDISRELEDMKKEAATLRELRVAMDERIEYLDTTCRTLSTDTTQAQLTAARSLRDSKMLQELKHLTGQAEALVKSLHEEKKRWQSRWAELNISLNGDTDEQPRKRAREPDPAEALVPNLASLPPPRTLATPVFRELVTLAAAPDGSVCVASRMAGMVAHRVWPDGSRPTLALSPATARATAVLPLHTDDDPDALLVVVCDEPRVERTGNNAWKRTTGFGRPFAAVVVGTTVLVTETIVGRVARVNLRTGEVIGTFGEGLLTNPTGIAVTPTGEIVVVSSGTKNVRVFDSQGALLHTLGEGRLRYPFGVCVDRAGRVYVSDFMAGAILVFDSQTREVLANIFTESRVTSVAVTCKGEMIMAVVLPSKESKIVVR